MIPLVTGYFSENGIDFLVADVRDLGILGYRAISIVYVSVGCFCTGGTVYGAQSIDLPELGSILIIVPVIISTVVCCAMSGEVNDNIVAMLYVRIGR